jgi:hypothetical protein
VGQVEALTAGFWAARHDGIDSQMTISKAVVVRQMFFLMSLCSGYAVFLQVYGHCQMLTKILLFADMNK